MHAPEPDEDDLMRELRRQASMHPPLGPREQRQLLERSAAGDGASQERLAAASLGMLIALAEERQWRGLSLPDLVQEGSLGLVEAIRTFAGAGEPDFTVFAARRAREQMDAALEAEAAAVRDAQLLVAAATDYERTELSLGRELKRPPTERELAEKLEWTVERTRYVAEVVAEARRRHDEELLAFLDPDAIGGAGDTDDLDEEAFDG